MRVALLTYGSRGDVQPFVALGVGLRRAGHGAILAAPERFAGLAAEHGLEFAPLPGDIEQLSRDLVEQGGRQHGLALVQVMLRHVLPIATEAMVRMNAAARGADLVVHTFLTTVAGHIAARQAGVPDISAQLFPFFAPYEAFPNVGVGAATLGGRLNRLSHDLATQLFWRGSQMNYGWLRRRRPEIGPPRMPWPAPGLRTPLLLAYSELLAGPAPAGLPQAQTTGFWVLDAPEYEPPRELAAFLAAGPPPIYIGFGSMVPRDAGRLAALALEALRRTGRRGVLLRGWAGLGGEGLPDDVIAIDGAPHEWLFPRMAAVVHHGGAGTTGAALRAGVPSLAVPFTADQPFWGRRAHGLGVGPPPIPERALTAEALAAAILQLGGPELRRRAAAVGALLRAEGGVGAAVRFIEARAG